MYLIPTRFGSLAKAAEQGSKDDGSMRWQTRGVYIEGGGKLCIASTDTKVLAEITIEDNEQTTLFIDSKLSLPPEGHDKTVKGIIPLKAWNAAFEAAKLLHGDRINECNVVGVAAYMKAGVPTVLLTATNWASDRRSVFSIESPLEEGRFPPFKDIFPKDNQRKFMLSLDAEYLQDLLAIARTVNNEELPRIDISYFGDGKPATIIASGDRCESLRMLIMPLVNG